MKMKWNVRSAAALLAAATLVTPAFGNEGAVPKGVPRLDHVFVIMMENHGYNQVLGNPSQPFMNKYVKEANLATNYFAVAHPSLTNYLEITGGSNFGILNDNSPDWHNGNCTSNIRVPSTHFDVDSVPNCPVSGDGTDAATPVIDTSNETTPPAITAVTEIDGKMSIPADPNISGKTIADQLVAHNMSWKSYQESLPPSGADGVNNADGQFSNLSDLTTALDGATVSAIVALYAVKHNPFMYFLSVENGSKGSGLSLDRSVGFEGPRGLYADLASGDVPNYSFIVPNQCNDQHGRGNPISPACLEDPNDQGTLAGLNPALMQQGDQTIETLVTAIKASRVWHEGKNAIVIVWDENDYSAAPYPNKVVLTVDTNYGKHGVKSAAFYTHFSLLRSIEGGFRLPCLNHACDATTNTMTDLFKSDSERDNDDN
jgi:hypothetical protein